MAKKKRPIGKLIRLTKAERFALREAIRISVEDGSLMPYLEDGKLDCDALSAKLK